MFPRALLLGGRRWQEYCLVCWWVWSVEGDRFSAFITCVGVVSCFRNARSCRFISQAACLELEACTFRARLSSSVRLCAFNCDGKKYQLQRDMSFASLHIVEMFYCNSSCVPVPKAKLPNIDSDATPCRCSTLHPCSLDQPSFWKWTGCWRVLQVILLVLPWHWNQLKSFAICCPTTYNIRSWSLLRHWHQRSDEDRRAWIAGQYLSLFFFVVSNALQVGSILFLTVNCR